jgi:hypothetical protein
MVRGLPPTICSTCTRPCNRCTANSSQVVRDSTGVTSMAIIKTIIVGERDTQRLAPLRTPHCHHDADDLAKALQAPDVPNTYVPDAKPSRCTKSLTSSSPTAISRSQGIWRPVPTQALGSPCPPSPPTHKAQRTAVRCPHPALSQGGRRLDDYRGERRNPGFHPPQCDRHGHAPGAERATLLELAGPVSPTPAFGWERAIAAGAPRCALRHLCFRP